MTGTGKSELINSLLERPAAKTNAFGESTKRVRVVRGTVNGIQVGCWCGRVMALLGISA